MLLEQRHDRVGRDVAGHDQRRVRRLIHRLVEGPEILGGKALQRRLGPGLAGAVAMRRPEHDARKRERRDLRRIVARLQQRGQPFLPESFEILSGKVGRNATSAMIGSASRSRATGTFRRTADASDELVVASSAPR